LTVDFTVYQSYTSLKFRMVKAFDCGNIAQ